MASIEWGKITDQMKVVETKTHFEVAGKLVTWGSKDSKLAQVWLHERAEVDKVRFKPGRKEREFPHHIGNFTRRYKVGDKHEIHTY